jgi:hypothetical protein
LALLTNSTAAIHDDWEDNEFDFMQQDNISGQPISDFVNSPNDAVDILAVSELHTEMQAMSKEKAERAKKIRDKINERESNPANQRLYFLINQKLNDPTFIQSAA